MSNTAIAGKILEFARAQRLARTLTAAHKPVPPHITTILAQGESLYASVPTHVQRSIDSQLAAANWQIDGEQRSAQLQADEQSRQASAAFREEQFRRAMGNGHGEQDVKKIAAGEQFLPTARYETDKRGMRTKVAETRKPNSDEQRRAQLILAAEKHGFGETLAGDLNGKRIAELREAERAVNPRADNRKVQIMNAMDAHDAIAYDEPTPDTSYADTTESSKDTITKSWNDLDTSTPDSSQESR